MTDTPATTLLPPFTTGDRVIHNAFTDCSGKHHPDSEMLEVESVQLEQCRSMPSYWRVKAHGLGERAWASREAAARFFRPA
jgi:hypothetical protein